MATDFNTKYNLISDPILDDNALLSPHPLSRLFVRVDTGLPPSLTDVQHALAPIVLIPQVPESVRHTFHLAKRLYLFGRFEYGFYTVSQHYAFLAMEAAIFSRWTASLPNPVKVETDKFTTNLRSPTHNSLQELWIRNRRKLQVNGQDFPNSMAKVLAQLEAKSMMPAETKARIAAAIDLRNALSHQESTTIFPPNTNTLCVVAEMINTLFDGLVLTSQDPEVSQDS